MKSARRESPSLFLIFPRKECFIMPRASLVAFIPTGAEFGSATGAAILEFDIWQPALAAYLNFKEKENFEISFSSLSSHKLIGELHGISYHCFIY